MPAPRRKPASVPPEQELNEIRIIGGSLRGRRLLYRGDPRTRPMKDRVREALFNLLGTLKGRAAIDLFAGTGALGLEALSRGAEQAIFIEQHFPTAKLIREHLATFELTGRAEVFSANTFLWAQRPGTLPTLPWVVFCSPPYAFYAERQPEMEQLLRSLLASAPPGSIIAVEGDARLNLEWLQTLGEWDIRSYPPAVVAMAHLPS